MQATLLLQYPEIVCASLIGMIMLVMGVGQNEDGGRFHLPAYMAEPAKALLMVLPQKYLLWVNQALMQGNLRSNMSLGDFAGAKLYLPLFALILTFYFPPHVALIAAVILNWLPDLYLNIRVQKRRSQISRALPQAID